MKSAKPSKSNGKKVNLKLNDLKAKKNVQGGTYCQPAPPGPSLPHQGMNHNEMFLADVG